MHTTHSEIHLLKKEKKLLKKLNTVESISFADMPDVELNNLTRHHFISVITTNMKDGDRYYQVPNRCEITVVGKEHLIHLSYMKKVKAIEWVRYSITTAIAVIALILSILAILC